MSIPALHKAWARQLICAVGGVEAAAAVAGVKPCTASRWQTGHLVMNALQIAALQSAAQTSLYSDALSSLVANAHPAHSGDPLPAAANAAREAGALPSLILAAQADQHIDERERRALLDNIAATRAALDQAERSLCGEAHLQAAE